MTQTEKQFNTEAQRCSSIFSKKLMDYGSAWRVLRTSSLTDQILIKAQRIRSFQVKKVQKIKEGILSEFIGIINYATIALIQLELGTSDVCDLTNESAINLYQKYINKAKLLMLNKNHDYDEAWRNMRISSFTDLILMKLFRTKQIEDNEGTTQISEGVDANYFDIINYAMFALIKLEENQQINLENKINNENHSADK